MSSTLERGPGGIADRWEETEEDGSVVRTARWYDQDGDPVRVALFGDSVLIATGRQRRWVALNDAQASELAEFLDSRKDGES